MTLRTAKVLLVFSVAIFYSLVVFSNITDYGSNYEFVRHVLMMDSTFPGNRGMWRAINTPLFHTVFYLSIIAWETITMLLCCWGGFRMAQALRGTACGVSASQKNFDRRADARSADVARRVSGHRRRMVLDVAVEIVEWPGRGFPHVHRRWNCAAARGATGQGRAALAVCARVFRSAGVPLAIFLFSTRRKNAGRTPALPNTFGLQIRHSVRDAQARSSPSRS